MEKPVVWEPLNSVTSQPTLIVKRQLYYSDLIIQDSIPNFIRTNRNGNHNRTTYCLNFTLVMAKLSAFRVSISVLSRSKNIARSWLSPLSLSIFHNVKSQHVTFRYTMRPDASTSTPMNHWMRANVRARRDLSEYWPLIHSIRSDVFVIISCNLINKFPTKIAPVGYAHPVFRTDTNSYLNGGNFEQVR